MRLDFSGRRFGRLVVVKRLPSKRLPCGATKGQWECVCDCGTKVPVVTGQLTSGGTKSCGCLTHDGSRQRLNLAGKRFGKLTVVEFSRTVSKKCKSGISRKTLWWCICDCGKRREVQSGLLRSGKARSCGCSKYAWGHGLTGKKYGNNQCTKEYALWASAKMRAKKWKLPFNIEVSDVVIPGTCPLLGIKIEVGRGKVHAQSPSLDRIRPAEGYVKGNIWVISYKANAMKHDASLAELQTLTKNLQVRLES